MAEAEALLAEHVPLAREVTGRDITLNRMRPLMALLGNPEKRLKVIHLAGTSGKTSTSYYIAKLLGMSGKKVGLTVSPHIDSVRERVQINLQPLGEIEFLDGLNQYLKILDTSDLEPTYFELLISFAYWYFDKAGVDYAVVETGMGGLHDGTNVAENPDKLCVITDIGLDHMHILGDTIEQIAHQKAGIIQPRNAAIMHKQSDEVMRVVETHCRSRKGHVLIAPDFRDKALEVLPDYQRRNWTLAAYAYQWIRQRDGLPELTEAQWLESLQVQVPGRMDAAKVNGKVLIMDGAHNEQKMQAFVGSFRQKYPGVQVPVLMALKQGKELTAVLPLIKPLTSKLIITSYDAGQDLPIPSIDTGELATAAKKLGFTRVIAEPDQDRAYRLLLDEPGDVGIITGSFYLIGQLRQRHEELRFARD